MEIKIQSFSEIPIYQQIVDAIKKQVAMGHLKGGDMLPSIRQLAKDIGVSVITTKRAFEELERQGFIETLPGKGSIVKKQSKDIFVETTYEDIRVHMVEVSRLANLANISTDEIITLFMKVREENE